MVYTERFVKRIEEIEEWALQKSELAMGALLQELYNPTIEEYLSSPKHRRRRRRHILGLLRSVLPPGTRLVIRKISSRIPALTEILGPDIKVVVDPRSSISIRLLKLILPHESAHVWQHLRSTRRPFRVMIRGDRKPLWNLREIEAQKTVFEKLKRSPTDIHNAVMFLHFLRSILPYRGTNKKEDTRMLEIFYNYYFGPVVHLSLPVPDKQHEEALAEASQLLSSYNSAVEKTRASTDSRFLKRIEAGEDLYRLAEEYAYEIARNIRKLPILPLVGLIRYNFYGLLREKKARKDPFLYSDLLWHVAKGVLNALKERKLAP